MASAVGASRFLSDSLPRRVRFTGRLVVDQQARLLKYNFEVRLDGLKLLKPVYLDGNPGGYTTLRIPDEPMKVYGNDVAFSGYIAV